MEKINKHIVIARSGIPRFSSMGNKSCTMIADILSKQYEKVSIVHVMHPLDIDLIQLQEPDLVLLGFKNIAIDSPNQDNIGLTWVSKKLDLLSINYTGSNHQAIELDHDKALAKTIVAAAGLSTASFFLAKPGEYLSEIDLPLAFPLFIKPPNEGGGSGISEDSIVRDFPAYQRKVQSITDNYFSQALVEKYLTGREFSVGIISGDSHSNMLAMPIEIIATQNLRGDRILSQAVKSEDAEVIIGVSEPILKELLSSFAKKVFIALGARDYGRIDVRMDENGKLHFLEANLIPGLAKHSFTSYFIAAAEINENMSHEQVILKIVDIAVKRRVNPHIDVPKLAPVNTQDLIAALS